MPRPGEVYVSAGGRPDDLWVVHAAPFGAVGVVMAKVGETALRGTTWRAENAHLWVKNPQQPGQKWQCGVLEVTLISPIKMNLMGDEEVVWSTGWAKSGDLSGPSWVDRNWLRDATRIS